MYPFHILLHTDYPLRRICFFLIWTEKILGYKILLSIYISLNKYYEEEELKSMCANCFLQNNQNLNVIYLCKYIHVVHFKMLS